MGRRAGRLGIVLLVGVGLLSFAGCVADAPPGNPTAVAGDGQVAVSWTTPIGDTGALVTKYQVTPFIGSVAQTPVVFNSTATTQTITGLVNGTAYRFMVHAINGLGYESGGSVLSNTVTPTAPVPTAIAAEPDTSKIVKVSSQTSDGYVWDYYRNEAYPCAMSGYQTFVIGRKVGSSDTSTEPLWVYLRGGGYGWFTEAGEPIPNADKMVQESQSEMVDRTVSDGLNEKVRNAGYRIVGVSMCSHDLYGGMNSTDPNNPYTTADGKARPTTGLISTKSAIAYAKAAYPTDDYFLHGTSAGSAGTLHTAWSLQLQGDPPTGLVADAAVINHEAAQARVEQGLCAGSESGDGLAGLAERVHPDVANPNNQPHLLVAQGALTVPVAHVWNKADSFSCGDATMQCPVNGTTVTLGATECIHRPLTLTIDALGPSSRSMNVPVCVEGPDTTTVCDRHVVTMTNGTSTLLGGPADYNQAIWNWVQQRRTDD